MNYYYLEFLHYGLDVEDVKSTLQVVFTEGGFNQGVRHITSTARMTEFYMRAEDPIDEWEFTRRMRRRLGGSGIVLYEIRKASELNARIIEEGWDTDHNNGG